MNTKKDNETNGEMWERLFGIKNILGHHKPERSKKKRASHLCRDYPGELLLLIEAKGWPLPEREYHFHPIRKWRLDLAWPSIKLAVECHGGIHTQGRHTRGTGFTEDREKMNNAAMRGWTIVEVACPGQIAQSLTWIENLLKEKGQI